MAPKTPDATANDTFGEQLIKADAAAIDLAYRCILDGEPLPVVSNPVAMSQEIARRIKSATTPEEILRAQTLPAWRDRLGHVFLVQRFHLNASNVEGGSSVYAVVEAVDTESGEQVVMSCGGTNVLMQLVKLLELGALPRELRLTGKRTAEGYTALWLQDA